MDLSGNSFNYVLHWFIFSYNIWYSKIISLKTTIFVQKLLHFVTKQIFLNCCTHSSFSHALFYQILFWTIIKNFRLWCSSHKNASVAIFNFPGKFSCASYVEKSMNVQCKFLADSAIWNFFLLLHYFDFISFAFFLGF